MMSFRRMLLINIIVIIVIVGGGLTGYYFYNQSINYVTTDDANIEGQMITISAPASGKLVDWSGNVGETFDQGETVGTIAMQASGKQGTKTMQKSITFPDQATIVKQSAVENSYVAPGTPLAYAFNLDKLWVTANIDQSDIDAVDVGQSVDIYVDGYSGTTLTGVVKQIGLATESTFSLLPSPGSSNDEQIPVKISIDGYKGVPLKPGMSVTVRINK
ncbi:MAG TPA: HlyD family efflux transporter periplasmic adaptor subunit [Bacillales bacterium]|nr:HlyD family efflux transporter periplasmic adaptor subunit [Bacillales bacterium]